MRGHQKNTPYAGRWCAFRANIFWLRQKNTPYEPTAHQKNTPYELKISDFELNILYFCSKYAILSLFLWISGKLFLHFMGLHHEFLAPNQRFGAYFLDFRPQIQELSPFLARNHRFRAYFCRFRDIFSVYYAWISILFSQFSHKIWHFMPYFVDFS